MRPKLGGANARGGAPRYMGLREELSNGVDVNAREGGSEDDNTTALHAALRGHEKVSSCCSARGRMSARGGSDYFDGTALSATARFKLLLSNARVLARYKRLRMRR